MNRYCRLAMEHWQQADPARLAALDDPATFFSTLGDQVEKRVQELQEHLAGPDSPDETYLDKVGRLNAARLQAEEMALTELVWVQPPTAPDPPSTTDEYLWMIHRALNEDHDEQDQ